MNLLRWPAAAIYAALILGCVGMEWLQLTGALFAIGDGDGHINLLNGSFLLLTALSILGLAVSLLGCFVKKRVFAVIALTSGICALPISAAFVWNVVHATTWHYASWMDIGNAFDPLLCLGVIGFSWGRWRQMTDLSN